MICKNTWIKKLCYEIIIQYYYEASKIGTRQMLVDSETAHL